MGESASARRGGEFDAGAIYEAAGLELWLSARYAGAYLRCGMDLAGAFSGALARVAAGRFAILRYRHTARAVDGTRGAAAELRRQTHTRRPGPGHGVQDAEVRRLPQPAVAI